MIAESSINPEPLRLDKGADATFMLTMPEEWPVGSTTISAVIYDPAGESAAEFSISSTDTDTNTVTLLLSADDVADLEITTEYSWKVSVVSGGETSVLFRGPVEVLP